MKRKFKIDMHLPSLMFLLFLALKLLGFIEWSWLWVTAPIWITLSIALALCAIIFSIREILDAS